MTEFTVHVTRSSQANDPCFYVPFDIPSGTTILGPVSATADIRGEMSDRIVRLDASGILAEVARERLPAEFNAAISGRPLSRQLRGIEPAHQPIRRALGSPVHIEGIRD